MKKQYPLTGKEYLLASKSYINIDIMEEIFKEFQIFENLSKKERTLKKKINLKSGTPVVVYRIQWTIFILHGEQNLLN